MSYWYEGQNAFHNIVEYIVQFVMKVQKLLSYIFTWYSRMLTDIYQNFCTTYVYKLIY